MATTKKIIAEWILEGLLEKHTHLIVVCDTFDYEDYPVYVSSGQNCQEIVDKYNGKQMQKVMEVYNLQDDEDGIIKQLTLERRAWHV